MYPYFAASELRAAGWRMVELKLPHDECTRAVSSIEKLRARNKKNTFRGDGKHPLLFVFK